MGKLLARRCVTVRMLDMFAAAVLDMIAQALLVKLMTHLHSTFEQILAWCVNHNIFARLLCCGHYRIAAFTATTSKSLTITDCYLRPAQLSILRQSLKRKQVATFLTCCSCKYILTSRTWALSRYQFKQSLL